MFQLKVARAEVVVPQDRLFPAVPAAVRVALLLLPVLDLREVMAVWEIPLTLVAVAAVQPGPVEPEKMAELRGRQPVTVVVVAVVAVEVLLLPGVMVRPPPVEMAVTVMEVVRVVAVTQVATELRV